MEPFWEVDMERNEYLIEGAMPLVRNEQLRIEDGRDLLVHAWQGALWITQEGDRRAGPGAHAGANAACRACCALVRVRLRRCAATVPNGARTRSQSASHSLTRGRGQVYVGCFAW